MYVYRSSSIASRKEESDTEADRLTQGMDKSFNDLTPDFTPSGTPVSQQLGVFHTVDEVYQSEFEGDSMISQPTPKGNSNFNFLSIHFHPVT